MLRAIMFVGVVQEVGRRLVGVGWGGVRVLEWSVEWVFVLKIVGSWCELCVFDYLCS